MKININSNKQNATNYLISAIYFLFLNYKALTGLLRTKGKTKRVRIVVNDYL